MLIQGSVNTDRTNILTERYNELINQGVEQSQILVIVLNSYKKEKFLNAIKNNDDLKEINVHTFFGLCYNAFLDNWGHISKLINNFSKNPCKSCENKECENRCIRKSFDISVSIKDINTSL